MLTTTFQLLKDAGACTSRYQFYAKHVGGVNKYGHDTPINLVDMLDHNGLDDALWCLRCCQDQPAAEKQARLLAADFAEHVLHFFEEKYPNDKRPCLAIEAARLYAHGEITDAARAAARDAAGAAAGDAAGAAAGDAAWAAAGDAEHKWQSKRFKEVLSV